MQKTTFFLYCKDFFMSKKFQMIFSAMACAFVISFSVIGFSRMNFSNSSLLASVTNLQMSNGKNIEFDADIAMILDDSVKMVAGKNMEKVDVVEGIIVYNPQENVMLESLDNAVEITKMTEGMYRFRANLSGKNVMQGENIFTMSLQNAPKSPMTLLDTQFVSEGVRYNLSNMVITE